MPTRILILGASGRAAAFSALRAGFAPSVIDLFADADLERVAPVRRISRGDYPHGVIDMARLVEPMPWMYTGGLENWPDVVAAISAERELIGNGPEVLRKVRDPFAVAAMLTADGVPHPRVVREPSPGGRWLCKPLRGAGGTGIRFAPADNARGEVYFQEFIEGESQSAVFRDDELLGVTRQLVGERWLHAAPFQYCGSIGPLKLISSEKAAWLRIASALRSWAGLHGIFGIDAVMRDGLPWPVEINPRYTASVEVLETGAAKAVYFAPCTFEFPHNGPWVDVRRFADIPHAGSLIHSGQPVLTMFGRDEAELRKQSGLLDSLCMVKRCS